MSEPTPRTVTTGQELEALIQENPRAVLELSDGSVCRAEKFRSLSEGLWEDELPATVLSPAPSTVHVNDEQVEAAARAAFIKDSIGFGQRPEFAASIWDGTSEDHRVKSHYRAVVVSALRAAGLSVEGDGDE